MRTIPRILFVSQTSLGSSTTNRYVQLCANLIPIGYRVTLFFIGKGKAADDRQIRYPRRIGDIRIRHTPALPSVFLNRANALISTAAGAFLAFTCLPALVLNALRHDVIVLGKPLPLGGFVTATTTWLTRRPMVLDLDDWEGVGGFATLKQGKNAFAKTVITFFEEWLPLRSKAVVVVSRLLAKRLQLMGITDDRIFHVPNGADINKFNPLLDGKGIRERYALDSRTVLAYLGTFKPGGASWQFMLDSFASVCRRNEQASLLIIGFGPQLDDAHRYAKLLGVESRVVFTGRVQHEDVPEFLAAADILILPYSDDFPDTYVNVGRSSLKLYEYMAMGKPVVASDIGELHDSLKDGGGILVQANVAQAFGNAILDLLQNSETMQATGKEARRRAENTYNYASLAVEFSNALKRALG